MLILKSDYCYHYQYNKNNINFQSFTLTPLQGSFRPFTDFKFVFSMTQRLQTLPYNCWLTEKPLFAALLLSQFPLIFHQIQKILPLLRDIPKERFSEEDIFKLGALAAASEFCGRIQVGIDGYISHQVRPYSPPWFSAACAAVMAPRNHSLFCANRINLLNLK